MSGSGPLSFEVDLSNDRYRATLNATVNDTKNFTSTLALEGQKWDGIFNRLGVAVGAAFTFSKAEEFVGQVVKIRGEFQQLEIAFTSMLQSKEKANDLMAQLVQTAATTPFNLREVAQGAKQLIAYGTGAEQVNDTLIRLGNVAAGLSVPLNDLVYLYGTLQSQGRAYATDIRQFAGRGIPIYEELAKVLGVSKDKVNDLVTAGKVGFPEIQKVFENLTNKGGMFYNLMAEQSKSLTGQISNLGDAWDMMLNKIGQSNEGVFSDAISFAGELVEHYQEIGNILAVLIGAYGSYKAALVAVSVAQGIAATTNASIAAGITAESGSLARNIALKIDNAQTTATLAAAIATETAARAANAEAIAVQTRAEFMDVAAKEATAAENLALATSEVALATERLAAAKLAAQGTLTAEGQMIAVKNVAIAQNELVMASEAQLAAEKTLASAAADVNAKKYFLDSTAKEANTAANIANATSEAAAAAAANVETVAKQRVTLATIIQTKTQAALNMVMNANPYVLLATALGALAVAIWVTTENTTAQSMAQEKLNEIYGEAKEKRDALKSVTEKAIEAIRSETESIYEQIKAYETLKSLYPDKFNSMTMEQIKTADLVKLKKELNEIDSKREVVDLSSKYEAEKKRLEELKIVAASMGTGRNAELVGKYADEWAGIGKRIKASKAIVEELGEKMEENRRIAAEAAEMERVKALPISEQIDYYRQIEKELEVQIEAVNKSRESTKNVSTAVDILTGKVHGVAGAFGTLQPVIDGIDLKNLSDRLQQIQSTIKGLTSGNAVKDKAYFDDLQKKAKESYEAIPIDQLGSANAKQIKKEYDEATKAVEKYSLTEKKAKKPKRIDIALPDGSEAEYARLIQKAMDVLSKTPVNQIERVKAMQATIYDLTVKHEEAKRIVAVRNWQETLDYNKQQYEKYESILDAANSKITDPLTQLAAGQAPEVFKELLAGGKNYLEFLENQLDPIQKKVLDSTADTTDLSRFLILKTQINELKGVSSPFQQFTEELDKMKREAANNVQYINSLKEELVSLKAIADNNKTVVQLQEEVELRKRIKEAMIDQAAALKAFLQEVQGSDEKRSAILAKYRDLRSQALAEGKSTAAIDKAEFEALSVVAQEANSAWKKLQTTIYDTSTRNGLVKLAADTEAYYESIKNNSEYTKKQIAEAKANAEYANKQLSDFDTTNWLTVADAIGQIGQDLQGMEGALGAIGSLLAGATGQASIFAKNIGIAKDNLKALESGGKIDNSSTVAAAVQGISQLSNMLLNSIEKKKADKKSRELDAINFQVQMNKALNEEIRLRTILSENVYFKDYAGRIKDAIGSATDAVTKYNLALANLADQGKSLTGTKNTIDWGNVGKGALSGAGSGAVLGTALGSYIPVLGNVVGAVIGGAIGAVVGGVVGLISTATKSLYGSLFEQYPELIDANGQLNKSLAETLIGTNQVNDKTKLWLQDLINASDAMEEAKKQITDIVSELTGNLGTDLRDALVGAFESGEDAAYQFSQTVQKTLENALSNLIYSAVFSKAFSNLQSELENSLLGSGKSFAQVFAEFLSQSQDLTDSFNEAMKAAQEEGKKYGFDLFNGSDTSSNNSAAGGIARSMTEETGSLIVGQMNTIRINQATELTILRTQSTHLASIADNSRYLARIDKRLAKLNNDPWRALGIDEGP